jgi:hypothetical protein
MFPVPLDAFGGIRDGQVNVIDHVRETRLRQDLGRARHEHDRAQREYALNHSHKPSDSRALYRGAAVTASRRRHRMVHVIVISPFSTRVPTASIISGAET